MYVMAETTTVLMASFPAEGAATSARTAKFCITEARYWVQVIVAGCYRDKHADYLTVRH